MVPVFELRGQSCRCQVIDMLSDHDGGRVVVGSTDLAVTESQRDIEAIVTAVLTSSSGLLASTYVKCTGRLGPPVPVLVRSVT